MSRRPGAQIPTPPGLPDVHLARDHPRSAVAQLVREGAWVRVRPGAFVDATVLDGPDARRTLALARIAALRTQLEPGTVLTHTSAALLWGLPTLHTPRVTHVVQPYTPRSRASPDVVRRRRVLARGDVVERHGLQVTSLERTLVDCALTESVRGGVVVADAALHRGADRERCERALASMAGRRGVVRARLTLGLADDGAESAGESLARLALLEIGAPWPQTQVPVQTALGTFWADLGWPDHRVLAEYDGRGKYVDRPVDVVVGEKRREDSLLDEGWRLLRLTKEDVALASGLRRRTRTIFAGIPLTPRPMLAL